MLCTVSELRRDHAAKLVFRLCYNRGAFRLLGPRLNSSRRLGGTCPGVYAPRSLFVFWMNDFVFDVM